ncbi:MAG: hypothetical protein FWD26_02290 [Treponema sp.]|nr:hypothetical protein [Treponema sp.]
MLVFFKRLIYVLSNKIRRKGYTPEGKFTLSFNKIKKAPFDIKSESSYYANIVWDPKGLSPGLPPGQPKGALELGLKKSNCIAWEDITDLMRYKHEYLDQVIEAKIRLDSLDGYAAAGIMFRIYNDSNYYIALVSSKGYFRIDVVKDDIPRTLIAWTEVSNFNGCDIGLKIIMYEDNMIFLVNDKWLGEAADSSVAQGSLGFVLASYESVKQEITCTAWLDYISVETRTKKIAAEFKYWTNDSNINADCRLRLAETFAVMGEASKSLYQINRAWKRRDEAIRSVATADAVVRTRRELLLAARMSFSMKKYSDAEEFIDTLLDQWQNSAEGKLAFTEKLKILNELNKFKELKEFVLENNAKINKDMDFYVLTARCYWELEEYKASAEAWDKAFEINNENGVYAVNAAYAHEYAKNKKEALKRFIAAGKLFLNQDNNSELEALMPKLSALGSGNWEARALIGKWAFSLEDYKKCEEELTVSNKLRNAMKPRPKADPASFYLLALVLYLKGKNKEAIRFLERSVKLAPDYELFSVKLAEIKKAAGVLP